MFDRAKYSKEYKTKNKDKLKLQNHLYYIKNKKRIDLYNREYYKITKEKWMKLLKKRDMLRCYGCGCIDCFASIDFHHTNPGEKEFGIANLLYLKITPKRLEELNKVIPLCSNCHRKLHWEDKNEIRSENNGFN